MVISAEDFPNNEVEVFKVKVGKNDIVTVVDHIRKSLQRYLLQLFLNYLEIEDVGDIKYN